MKSRTLPAPIQQPPHISPISIQSPLGWKEVQKSPRCRLVDSYQFMMGLINADPSPVKNTAKRAKPATGKLNVTYGDAWPLEVNNQYTFED
ncbi:MAG TPA: hypothetical protein VFG10_03110 [Saprospiraceae bacterium]|nr:hypothetical protein [Saprospiraceae bacterium]